ncbi:MAG: DUF6491 family protein [Caulobacteraceae bacterium]
MFSVSSAFRVVLIAALTLAAAPVVAASGPTRDCFYITAWQGWKSPSPTVIYLKVNSDIYQIDLSVGSAKLSFPAMHLTSRVRDTSSICGPLDLDLEIADTQGNREPLIAKSITKLTPDEIAAIPPKYRP